MQDYLMVSVLNEKTRSSIRKHLSVKRHSETVKESFLVLPDIASAMVDVFKAAPYLIFVYILIAGIDIQYRIIRPPDMETAVFSIVLTLMLTTIANGLCYIEAYNTHTTRQRVPKTGMYVVKKSLTLAATLLASAFFILSGLFLFIIPGIYLAIRFSLAGPASIIDDLGVRESLTQSMRATKGKTLFTYITLGNIGVVIAISLLLIITSTGWSHLVFVFFAYGILPPIVHVLLALLYLNSSNGNRVNFYGDKRELTTREKVKQETD